MPLHRLIAKYILLQLPGYVLLILLIVLMRRTVEISPLAGWGAFCLWVLKDIALFPVLGRYYDPAYHRDRFSMVGQKGVVKKSLSPKGVVRVRGELWRAKAMDPDAPVDRGRRVVVHRLEGLTLHVKPEGGDK